MISCVTTEKGHIAGLKNDDKIQMSKMNIDVLSDFHSKSNIRCTTQYCMDFSSRSKNQNSADTSHSAIQYKIKYTIFHDNKKLPFCSSK